MIYRRLVTLHTQWNTLTALILKFISMKHSISHITALSHLEKVTDNEEPKTKP